MTKDLNEQVKELKNAYARQWRKRNPLRVRESIERYWIKKARELDNSIHEDGHRK